MKFLVVLLLCAFYWTTRASKKNASPSVAGGSTLLQIELQHNLGPNGDFVPRGFVQLKSLKSATASFHQNTKLSSEELNNLKKMAKTGDLYKIRTNSQINLLDDVKSRDNHYVLTCAKACSLLKSGLTETIWIHKDDEGNIYGLSLEIDSPCSIYHHETKTPNQFNTTILIDQGAVSMGPDTQPFLDKLKREQQEKESGKDNRSFLQKYWMYIVPLVLVLMMNSMQQAGGREE
ncbi:ER membrane protein complex subunit 10-like [Oscarella lobularis]|uniref:ER membrane protein complex subunit 10-like n=1 Tax=Oscarella lobularis TaxID=121494 RepID=UPI0033139212